MTVIVGSVIYNYHTSLNFNFGVNRTFHVLKTPVTDLSYMGGTGPCTLMTIIFGGIIKGRDRKIVVQVDGVGMVRRRMIQN